MPDGSTCFAVQQALQYETGRLGPDLFRKSVRERPIIGLVSETRGTFPAEMGYSFSNVTWERSMSTSTSNPWTTIVASDGGSNNACLPPVVDVTFGQTNRTVTPSQMALETPYYCVVDIRTAWQFAKQLNAITGMLAKRTSWEWARKFTYDYVDLAGHNLTLTVGGVYDNGSSGYSTANPPTAALDFGTLEEIYGAQYREGSSVTMFTAEDTGAPAPVIIVSDETYRNLLRNNPVIANQINYAYMGAKDGNPLLPSGIEKRRKLFGNWVVLTDPYPRRFALTGGVYVEIPVWVSSSTTVGNKQTINPAWLAAPYEETIVYHPDNYRSLGLPSLTNPAPGWTFSPINSMGEWELKNIIERDCNPDGTMVFWRAVFRDAAEPINPDVGYSILHLRCGYQHSLTNCYQYSSING